MPRAAGENRTHLMVNRVYNPTPYLVGLLRRVSLLLVTKWLLPDPPQ
jgi:hypothetical protein